MWPGLVFRFSNFYVDTKKKKKSNGLSGENWSSVRVCACVSAVFLKLLLVEQADVCEREVAFLALALAFPLAIHVDLRYRHQVAHLQTHKISQLFDALHMLRTNSTK